MRTRLWLPAILPLALAGATGCESRKVAATAWDRLDLEVVEDSSGAAASGGLGAAPGPADARAPGSLPDGALPDGRLPDGLLPDGLLPDIVCSVQHEGRVIARGLTGPDGTLRLEHAFPGPVRVELIDPADRFVPCTFDVDRPGRHRLPLERGVRVRFRVASSGGDPIGAARVSVWAAGGRVHSFHVDAFDPGSGVASLGPFPRGPAKLVIASPGHAAAMIDVSFDGRRVGPDGVQDIGEVRLFRGGGAVLGRVRASESRMPDRVLLRYGGAGQFAPVLADGSFRIEGLPDADAGAVLGALGPADGTLVLLRDTQEMHVRRVPMGGERLDVGTIRLR